MTKLRYFTAGESHGPGLTSLLEGLPAGLDISIDAINHQLQRRQQGYGRGGRMKIESDSVEIKGGLRHGKTLGSPLSLWVENKDFRAWNQEMSPEAVEGFESKKTVTKPRPGHADLNGGLKYGHRDLRNILERSSARETAARVAIGAICRQLLEQFGIQATAHVITIGGVSLPEDVALDFDAIQKNQEDDPCRCIDEKTSKAMQAKIDEAKKNGDSVGGVFEVRVKGLPVGLGSHVQWDRKLDGRLAQAILSIQAIKGVEFGLGFACGERFGSQVHDPIQYSNQTFSYETNNAGGMIGGMTTGEELIIRAVMKPISTLYKPLPSVDIETKESFEASIERSDTCAVPAAAVIAENVACIEIADAFLEKFGGDSLEEIERNFSNYLEQVKNY